jgi:hypothetical protein
MNSKLIIALKAIEKYVKELVGESAVVERHYVPLVYVDALSEMDIPLIHIIPSSVKITNTTIAMFQYKFEIDIVIKYKLKHKDDEAIAIEEIDKCIELDEKIIEQFVMTAKIDSESGLKIVCKEPEQIVLNDFESIAEDNCFFSVIRIKTEIASFNPSRKPS